MAGEFCTGAGQDGTIGPIGVLTVFKPLARQLLIIRLSRLMTKKIRKEHIHFPDEDMKQTDTKINPYHLKAVIFYEILGFGLIFIFLWLDEIYDLPHYLFRSMATPVNMVESIFESIMILVVGFVCIKLTLGLLSKIRILEGLLPICSSCKKIRDGKNGWQNIETYIEQRSNASFTHDLCRDCMDKLYGNQEWYGKKHDPV